MPTEAEVFAFLGRWAPWALIWCGIIGLPFSTIFFPQYVSFSRWLVSSRLFTKLLAAKLGQQGIAKLQERMNAVSPGDYWQLLVACVCAMAIGEVWLWLRG